MTIKRRREAIAAFTDDDRSSVFLLNKTCGAMGLNLTAATHVMILEPSWNPGACVINTQQLQASV